VCAGNPGANGSAKALTNRFLRNFGTAPPFGSLLPFVDGKKVVLGNQRDKIFAPTPSGCDLQANIAAQK